MNEQTHVNILQNKVNHTSDHKVVGLVVSVARDLGGCECAHLMLMVHGITPLDAVVELGACDCPGGNSVFVRVLIFTVAHHGEPQATC